MTGDGTTTWDAHEYYSRDVSRLETFSDGRQIRTYLGSWNMSVDGWFFGRADVNERFTAADIREIEARKPTGYPVVRLDVKP